MKKTPEIIKQFIIICVISLFSLGIYAYTSHLGYNEWKFTGGLTYFIYTSYWILKVKNNSKRIIVWSIFQWLFIMTIGVVIIAGKFNALLPTLLLLNLIAYTCLLIENPRAKDKNKWKAYLYTFLITSILSFLGIALWCLGIGLIALSRTRY